jgi:tight adherence protein B
VGPARAVVPALPVAAALLLVGWWSGLLVPALLLAAAGAAGGVLWVRRVRRRAADEVATRVLRACEELAADLRSDVGPDAALRRGAADWPLLTPVTRAQELGLPVPGALRELARAPGAADLRVVAAAWEVARDTGPGLASTLDRVADSLRADRATARVVAAELASARATARLLAGLPVAVLLVGGGNEPWRFLVGSPLGWACLGGGLVLVLTGLAWLEALASDAGR